MLVYEGIKSGFIDDVDLGIIADKIRNKYITVTNKDVKILKENKVVKSFDSFCLSFFI